MLDNMRLDHRLLHAKHGEKMFFEPDEENPNDIWCPTCKNYKKYAIAHKPIINGYSNMAISYIVCPDCKGRVEVK